ncbi:PREDICTED: RBPJ-interacting and tubulin-associated protein 1 [Nanorana parkeri]|uniref:RBPJ-interacting and tubulin-associated protein 1 n=1 Tax=Nanorana parkeri TaxID=125878 RepID=UPI0008540DAE|nr:PREDICTED: RBPJ-interacting and tubulin-associated protein 1 [Nanorana parkeri]
MNAVDMSLDLSITGHSSSFPPRKTRSAYRFKAAKSFVDETLFGGFGNKVDPALQWTTGSPGQVSLSWRPEEEKESKGRTISRTSCTPPGTPRRKIHYRVKSRSPSYCDESLFGPKVEECGWEAPWVKKEDAVRIRPLLWSPPPVVRPQSSKSSTKQLPLKAVHPHDTGSRSLETQRMKEDFWKPPDSDSDSGGCPSGAGPPSSATVRYSSSGKNPVRSASCSGRLTARRGSMTERPPWK